eukprot:scpid105879/ scgid29600/ 
MWVPSFLRRESTVGSKAALTWSHPHPCDVLMVVAMAMWAVCIPRPAMGIDLPATTSATTSPGPKTTMTGSPVTTGFPTTLLTLGTDGLVTTAPRPNATTPGSETTTRPNASTPRFNATAPTFATTTPLHNTTTSTAAVPAGSVKTT